MGKITIEGNLAFVEFMEDKLTDAMMECGKVYFGHHCEREEEDYCRYECPFKEEEI